MSTQRGVDFSTTLIWRRRTRVKPAPVLVLEAPSHLFRQLFVLSTGQQRSTRGLVAHQCKYMHKYVARHGAGEYLVPALAGVNLTLTLTLLAALSIVREVERGTWHGLLTTPAGAAAIVLGKLASYFVLGLLLFAALTALAAALFDTPLAAGRYGSRRRSS